MFKAIDRNRIDSTQWQTIPTMEATMKKKLFWNAFVLQREIRLELTHFLYILLGEFDVLVDSEAYHA